ncbi:MAG: hypothetical protein QXL52_01980 [Nitrososphaerales archaeon]
MQYPFSSPERASLLTPWIVPYSAWAHHGISRTIKRILKNAEELINERKKILMRRGAENLFKNGRSYRKD